MGLLGVYVWTTYPHHPYESGTSCELDDFLAGRFWEVVESDLGRDVLVEAVATADAIHEARTDHCPGVVARKLEQRDRVFEARRAQLSTVYRTIFERPAILPGIPAPEPRKLPAPRPLEDFPPPTVAPAECRVCERLGDSVTDDPNRDVSFPPEALELEPVLVEGYRADRHLRRCPLCGTLYRYDLESENCPTTPQPWETLTRLERRPRA
ncbi:MAG TPA: hypothetical protein VFF73_15210 [Planctomycetota bacterium]|nr:hypothetical protein [Planctomycetota bacterium]